MMSSCRLVKTKTFAVLFASLIMIAAMTASSLDAVIPPCPVVSDVTIAQMAKQWAEMFKEPYCDFLQERRNVLIRRKISGGVFSCAGQMTGIFRTSEEEQFSLAFKTEGTNTNKIDFKSTGIREVAAAKLRTLRTMVSITTYAAAKDSYEKTVLMEKLLQGFAPIAFDHVSKHQAQKDAVKLAHLLGLVQAQELKITSLLKMMYVLEGKY